MVTAKPASARDTPKSSLNTGIRLKAPDVLSGPTATPRYRGSRSLKTAKLDIGG